MRPSFRFGVILDSIRRFWFYKFKKMTHQMPKQLLKNQIELFKTKQLQ